MMQAAGGVQEGAAGQQKSIVLPTAHQAGTRSTQPTAAPPPHAHAPVLPTPAGTARCRPILTLLPLQVLFYFGGWWDALFWALSICVFVYKGGAGGGAHTGPNSIWSRTSSCCSCPADLRCSLGLCAAGVTLPYPPHRFAAEFAVQWLFLIVEPVRLFLGEAGWGVPLVGSERWSQASVTAARLAVFAASARSASRLPRAESRCQQTTKAKAAQLTCTASQGRGLTGTCCPDAPATSTHPHTHT
jgi:hypothetical protein